MPISDSAARELAQLLHGASAGELIPELVRQGLQALIEAEAAAVICADRQSARLSGAATAMAARSGCWLHPD